MPAPNLAQRLAAEALGTGFLLMAVVGSGIMAERLAGGNVGLALLANALATGAGLIALILAYGPISGAHFNPLVSALAAWRGEFPAATAALYAVAQLLGASLGVMVAHIMFGLPAIAVSANARAGVGQWLGEVVATFGLLVTIFGGTARAAVPYAVGLYIAAAYWFTSSTSFANPVAAIARSLTSSFAGIAPANVPAFIAAELLGAILALLALRFVFSASGEKG